MRIKTDDSSTETDETITTAIINVDITIIAKYIREINVNYMQ